MPKDDQVFFADIEAANQEFLRATHEDENLKGILFYEPSLNHEVQARLDRFQDYYYYFRDLGRISGGTQPIIEHFDDSVLPHLATFRLNDPQGPIPVIRLKLGEGVDEGAWQGPPGSASYQFKTQYLPSLSHALEKQYWIVKSMRGVMEIHQAVIDQARQKYLDLINNTTAAIEHQHQDSSSLSVTQVVNSVATGFTVGGVVGAEAGAEAGPVGLFVGAFVGAIHGIGTAIDNSHEKSAGSDWFSITNNTLNMLGELVTDVGKEAGKVQSSLATVLEHVEGRREEFIAPKVNFER